MPWRRTSTSCAARSTCKCWEALATDMPVSCASVSTLCSPWASTSRSSRRWPFDSALPMRANCSYNRSLNIRFACLSMYLTSDSSKSTTETRRIDEVDIIPTLNRILEYWNGVKSGYGKNRPLHQGHYHSIVTSKGLYIRSLSSFAGDCYARQIYTDCHAKGYSRG